MRNFGLGWWWRGRSRLRAVQYGVDARRQRVELVTDVGDLHRRIQRFPHGAELAARILQPPLVLLRLLGDVQHLRLRQVVVLGIAASVLLHRFVGHLDRVAELVERLRLAFVLVVAHLDRIRLLVQVGEAILVHLALARFSILVQPVLDVVELVADLLAILVVDVFEEIAALLQLAAHLINKLLESVACVDSLLLLTIVADHFPLEVQMKIQSFADGKIKISTNLKLEIFVELHLRVAVRAVDNRQLHNLVRLFLLLLILQTEKNFK